MKIETYTETSHYAQVNFFGKIFHIPVENPNKVTRKNIKDYIRKEIIQVSYEWGRKDDKKVLLFYSAGSMKGFAYFMFSVEADDLLKNLMKDSHGNLAHIVEYVFKNEKKLNCKI